MLVPPQTNVHDELPQVEIPVVEISSPPSGDALDLLPPSKRDLSDKKRKGVFYTPDAAAQLLAEWSIRNANDIILEPSFGGCGFLEAALNQLGSLGAENPHGQLLGCDVDPNAFDYLVKLLEGSTAQQNFKLKDFLGVVPSDFQVNSVDAVIGNPPYVSWHNMLPSQRESASKVLLPNGESLNNKGSLWTFFLAHSLQFLNTGGRMAWILPGSFIYADYAAPLRAIISEQFSRTLAVMLEQRIFLNEGTEESSIILLCEDYKPKARGQSGELMRLALVATLPELKNTIQAWTDKLPTGFEWDQEANRLLLPEAVMRAYDSHCHVPSYTNLGTLVKIRIGLVTGDNSFFVLKSSQATKLKIPKKALRPIIARQAHFRGLQVTDEDLNQLVNDDVKCLLLNTNCYKDKRISYYISRYLNTYPKENIAANRTFAKRKPWHQIAQEHTPDGFFSCMNWHGPMLVLNPAQATCTNTVYRIQFESTLFTHEFVKQHVAVSLQSTFSQLSAEISGRSCGSGALKLEPSEAGRIGLLLPPAHADASPVFDQIDTLLREGHVAEARRAADQFLIEYGLLTTEEVAVLDLGLRTLRKIRRGDRSPTTD
ncbi:Eco57I restriction-modification methylase domain-containing protein [Hymenobacter sp. APR13]|uniref:Eco57I restriction-modification methylase domain-containing protein n=1 Tax=Hymenobacter sp. APR13 TaxID=1356852 RepID=UPI0009DCCBFC|nr:N-6 DNA methylase [Hymenobacter sp. APR13]